MERKGWSRGASWVGKLSSCCREESGKKGEPPSHIYVHTDLCRKLKRQGQTGVITKDHSVLKREKEHGPGCHNADLIFVSNLPALDDPVAAPSSLTFSPFSSFSQHFSSI